MEEFRFVRGVCGSGPVRLKGMPGPKQRALGDFA